MNGDDINSYVPSLLNPRCVKKQDGELSLTQHSFVSRTSLSLRRSTGLKLKAKPQIHPVNKENSQNVRNLNTFENNLPVTKVPQRKKTIDRDSLGFSAIEDIHSAANNFDTASLEDGEIQLVPEKLQNDCEIIESNVPLISVSSNTELDKSIDTASDATIIYNVDERPTISVSFGINHCKSVDINSKKSHIKRVLFSQNNDNTLVDCEILESSNASSESDLDENMNESVTPNSLKRSAVTVNLEIKKKKTSPETECSKVLILNTSAVEKISHVIVQPPNYKLLKISDSSKIKSVTTKTVGSIIKKGIVRDGLKQKYIDNFFNKRAKVSEEILDKAELVKIGENKNGDQVMSRKSSLAEKNGSKLPQFGRRPDREYSAGAIKYPSPSRKVGSPRPETASSLRGKAGSPTAFAPRHDSLQFSIPSKTASKKSSAKPVPHHKIVAGTHFAVDAFSYGDIPNVKHYFLTHFHSDHYTGLKKTFNKVLYCSKITAELCISRLGVNPKVIHIINVDEVLRVDNVEVTTLEANHCPGAVMLVFTLPSGKTLLHTGDFRASPIMESYPIFWNKDVHTIYLDTTYCNPRYDFPTQEQSLEMALYLLRQKKLALEKAGKKFSSVLIVCGTYTIGKEKFFLGMSRRVGCSVWACPEKERVLAAVEGRSFAHAKPTACQLHVVPMRDLSHEKLRAYLDSFQGVFSEVVAFKPSGWENGKSCVERDLVTIHGIPYSEHSSFSELVRFVKYLKPKQVVPTVDISGGVRAVQKYFPCPLVPKEDVHAQSKLTDFFSIKNQQQVPAVT